MGTSGGGGTIGFGAGGGGGASTGFGVGRLGVVTFLSQIKKRSKNDGPFKITGAIGFGAGGGGGTDLGGMGGGGGAVFIATGTATFAGAAPWAVLRIINTKRVQVIPNAASHAPYNAARLNQLVTGAKVCTKKSAYHVPPASHATTSLQ